MIFRRPSYFPTWGMGSAFEELERMRRQLDEVFGGGTGRRSYRLSGAGVFPLINLTEDKENYYVRAELPGLSAADIDISVTGRNLSIAGERKIPSEDENVRYHRRERDAGTFSRLIALPGEVDADKVEAKHVNGILTVAVPKAEAAKPKQITVR
ncbi:MAG: Hsp20/alpha crystallin family protein [Desulfobacterales bacterium]